MTAGYTRLQLDTGELPGSSALLEMSLVREAYDI